MRRLLIPQKARTLRRNNFDLLRLLMAMLVIWSHSFALYRGSEATEPVSVLMAGTYNSGNIAVLTFFTISGFLITLSWLRAKSWRDYLRRRVARIVPGYVVALTLCSLVVVPAFSSRPFGVISPHESFKLLSNVLLRNYIVPSDAFGGGVVNGSLWSIPYEFYCYLGVMGLGLAGLFRWRHVYLLLAVAAMALRFWVDLTAESGNSLELALGVRYFWWVVLPTFVVPAFLLGGAVCLYRDLLPRRAMHVILFILATTAAAHLPSAEPWRTAISHLLLPPALAYLVFYAAFSATLCAPDVASYGDFSYGVYLYAWPVQQMLLYAFRDRLGFAAFIALSLLLSLAAGVASWHLVERWFLPPVRRARIGENLEPPLTEETAIVAP